MKKSAEKSLAWKTATGFGWQFGSVATTALLQIVVTAVLARRVTPEAFGLVALAQVATTFITMFAQAGISAAIIQRKTLTAKHIQVGFTATLLLGILATAFLWLVSPLLAAFFRNEALSAVLKAISVNFTLVSLGAVSRALLEREFRFRSLMRINVVSYVLGYSFVGIVMALSGFGVWALVSAIVAQNLVMGLMLFAASPHPLRLSLARAEFRELIGYGGGLTLSQLFNNIALQADNLVIGRLLGADALGVYGRAYQIVTLPFSYIGQVIDRVSFPAMAKIQDDKPKLKAVYLSGVSIGLQVLIPVGIIIAVTAPEIVRVLLGPAWDAAVVPLQILAACTALRIVTRVTDSLVRALGAVYRSALRKSIFAAAVIAGSWAGHFWSLPGVAVGVVLAVTLNAILMTLLAMQLAELRAGDIVRAVVPGLLLGALALIVSMPTALLLRHLSLPALVVLLSVGMMTMLALAWLSIRFPVLLGDHSRWLMTKLAGVISTDHPLLRWTHTLVRHAR